MRQLPKASGKGVHAVHLVSSYAGSLLTGQREFLTETLLSKKMITCFIHLWDWKVQPRLASEAIWGFRIKILFSPVMRI